MSEPIYEFVPGKGWVANSNTYYIVEFHGGLNDMVWRNALGPNFKFSLDEANKRLKIFQYEYDRYIQETGWEFRVTPVHE
jgi:hypothetical protein